VVKKTLGRFHLDIKITMLSRCEGALPRVQEKRRSSIDESKNKNTMKNIKG